MNLLYNKNMILRSLGTGSNLIKALITLDRPKEA
jgi:hypothetical protein